MSKIIARKALAHFGFDHQCNVKLIGEIGELLDALAKWREGREAPHSVLAEIIDVQQVLKQMEIHFSDLIGEPGIAGEIRLEKMEKLINRLQNR